MRIETIYLCCRDLLSKDFQCPFQAVAVASSISDRICIHSKGKLQTEISAKNLLACEDDFSAGCSGGYPYYAWVHWKEEGLVTGGSYRTQIVSNE